MSTLALAEYVARTRLRVMPGATFERVDPPRRLVQCRHGTLPRGPIPAMTHEVVELQRYPVSSLEFGMPVDTTYQFVSLAQCKCGKVYWQP